MFDFPLDADLPPTELNSGGIAMSALQPATDTSTNIVNGSVTEIHTRYARVVLVSGNSKKFLAQVNNRVALGTMTIMLPGGIIKTGDQTVNAIKAYIHDQVGITMDVHPGNCRFIQNRAYELQNDHASEKQIARVDFFTIDIGTAVPYNMMPDSVLSLSWLSLLDVERYTDLDGAGWKIQLGALDAIQAVLDPDKARITDGSREITRQDGGKMPEELYKAVAPLAYSA